MVHNTFLTLLLLLLLGFSNLPYSSAAIPTSSLRSNMEDSSSAQKQDLMAQSEMQLGDVGEELFGNVGEEGFIEGRMDMENNDYPGTGANNHHDPKTPGIA
ncbi:hypothetical protein FNV43_RR15371 [Rhamnella rubrinervis]|uniref:Uncharacterized protein n=1 Tax=Rhamnella rubrinervis TaxID=2594499 RepID=A0A8K0ECQ3_9ROSA|nr:hypothetical protein FNV43_RR15371 [Rhamnella rubrinervis]